MMRSMCLADAPPELVRLHSEHLARIARQRPARPLALPPPGPPDEQPTPAPIAPAVPPAPPLPPVERAALALSAYRERFPRYPDRGGRVRPTVHEICRVAAAYYEVSFDDIVGNRRLAKCVHPRHVAVFLSRRVALRWDTSKSEPDLAPLSWITLGNLFRRDHTTIIHAYRRIERMTSDPEAQTSREVADLLQILGASE